VVDFGGGEFSVANFNPQAPMISIAANVTTDNNFDFFDMMNLRSGLKQRYELPLTCSTSLQKKKAFLFQAREQNCKELNNN
jgi:hypothetical protein